jgi:hypothetical protein
MGTFYHLTSKARFKLDPRKTPEDNALAIRMRDEPGLFLVSQNKLNRWILGHGYFRPFVAELEVDEKYLRPERWAGEMFLPSEHFRKARITRVIPIDVQAREEFGEYGWTEAYFETTFDTEEPIPEEKLRGYPWRGWRWKGDVRRIALPWVRQYKKRVRDYLRQSGKR